ncbi:MAG TPA: peptide chain release factor 2 [Candidatus Pacearchaeota archaeon]|nr:peptide chain release factor 2 [Candidatus Pacearchaeota archaeon]
MEISEKDLREIEERIIFLENKLDLDESKKKIEELQKQTEAPDFWNNTDKAKEISQELKEIKEDTEIIDYFKKEITDLQDFFQILEEGTNLEEEFEGRFLKLKKDVLKKEIELNFIGKYDASNAVFTIMAGAGGKEAEDWALMLLRMYQRYFEKKGFNVIILDELLGEGNEGIKTVTLEVKGKYAYGYLRRESGVHRLVRLSPFSAQNLRHTSFALVDVLPVIKESESVKINPEDLRVDYFRASGPGGQYVNTRDSAVRITHIPTNIAVSCQVERSQLSNKEKAMSMLLSKLYVLEEQKRREEIAKEKGEKVSAGWGNQIRSYVLQPYRMVKDLRTKIETSNTEAVLNGDIDKFIEEEIRVLD